MILNDINDDFLHVQRLWRKNDNSNSAGQEIDTLTSSTGRTQIIDKPTHVINNSLSGIYLIFCTNWNVISKHGIYDSIFEKYHHNINYGKVNIHVPLSAYFLWRLRLQQDTFWNIDKIENI